MTRTYLEVKTVTEMAEQSDGGIRLEFTDTSDKEWAVVLPFDNILPLYAFLNMHTRNDSYPKPTQIRFKKQP